MADTGNLYPQSLHCEKYWSQMTIIASTCPIYKQQREWRWTKEKVWRGVQSLPSPADWWCDLPMNSGRESKRVLDLLLCHPPANGWTQGLCVCMRSSQKHPARECWGDGARKYEAQLLVCMANAASAARCVQVLMQTEVEGWMVHQK